MEVPGDFHQNGPGRIRHQLRPYLIAKRKTRVATWRRGMRTAFPAFFQQGAGAALGEARTVIGRVTMDMTMVDVTDIPDCRVGDEAVLIGSQGEQEITALEVAEWARRMRMKFCPALAHGCPG